ncbi:glycosyltransferase family 33 protein [Schizophyllum commune H4-8]|uniref:Chitobiosyldiphosphodolichol beta-mannosyltransferase n=1 Tax=Schizophyllum commune (strain H4-8 / FGSC 9210) TaxID=578458 RepID=D8PLN9_SCHCM|nr:glycosyltransferase family 33 protein [Schizophyllum commune H4-8]KAI5897410.1 glycosyltransferase family 33 protein [Schizophyllum commune H4-8]
MHDRPPPADEDYVAPAAGLAILLLIITYLAWKTVAFLRPRNQHSLRSVAILVLGDIGRSPRMMYHAQSFAECDFVTDVIGYNGSKVIPSLERLPKVQLHHLAEPPSWLRHFPFIITAPFKIFHQILTILVVLIVDIEEAPEFLLVQNPPSIPTLALAWLVGRIRGSKVIIDWHNLGCSILALKLGENHVYVRISKWFERYFGRTAYAHLFVTQAMRDYLVREWELQGHKIVLHDMPHGQFHRATPQEIHDVRLPSRSLPPRLPPQVLHTVAQPTFTEIAPPHLRRDRPALVVSSTSWTADEDFGVLIEALGAYEGMARAASEGMTRKASDGKASPLPKILCIVTGKGPLKTEYMRRVGKLQANWQWVRCVSLWLEAEDYPLLLGAADLGVSLHTSSSALDLPMKVVDMFGAGTPVCALDFACISELVKHGKNGLVFKTSEELAEQMKVCSHVRFPRPAYQAGLVGRAQGASMSRAESTIDEQVEDEWEWSSWDVNWAKKVRPLLLWDALGPKVK